jgi:hypothetical protein
VQGSSRGAATSSGSGLMGSSEGLLEQAATPVAACLLAIGEETHRNRRAIKKHACQIVNWVAQTFHRLFGLFDLYAKRHDSTPPQARHALHGAAEDSSKCLSTLRMRAMRVWP